MGLHQKRKRATFSWTSSFQRWIPWARQNNRSMIKLTLLRDLFRRQTLCLLTSTMRSHHWVRYKSSEYLRATSKGRRKIRWRKQDALKRNFFARSRRNALWNNSMTRKRLVVHPTWSLATSLSYTRTRLIKAQKERMKDAWCKDEALRWYLHRQGRTY